MNLTSTLAQFVRSQARKELKPLMIEAKKRASEHRRSIAALKREVANLHKLLKATAKQLPERKALPEPVEGSKLRLRVDGMKALRHRLGLSAKEMGILLNVSALTVYNWEHGKSKPRRKHLPRIAQVRELGKREAAEALRLLTI
jgi:DNA-binding transcriptional regulator YiaG